MNSSSGLSNMDTLKAIVNLMDSAISPKLADSLVDLSCKYFINLFLAKLLEDLKSGKLADVDKVIEIQNIAAIAQINL